VAAARETADGEMWRWQSKAFGSDPVRDALPMDAGWALKCLAETACCVTDMRQDGVAGAAETAAATAAFNVNNRAAAYGLLAKRLFSLLHTGNCRGEKLGATPEFLNRCEQSPDQGSATNFSRPAGLSVCES
jgi:hypothetical protein